MRPKKGAKGHKYSVKRNSGYGYNPTWIERQVSNIGKGKGIASEKGKKC